MNRNYTAVCAAILMCALIFVFYGSTALNKSALSFADTATESISKSSTDNSDEHRAEKVIYLTFDDGPSDRVTPKILDVLQEENVKATFFIIGKHAETRKYLLKREFDEGHTIGVHSYSHNYKEIYSSPESLIADIDKCNGIIREITGSETCLYRFPGGSFGLDNKLISAVTRHGMRYVDWNASTRDAEIYSATPAQLYKAAIETPAISDYIVMLAHDTTTKTATAEALRDIIKYYKQNDYVFATF